MSSAPFYLFGIRNGVKFGHQNLVDGVIHDGLWCAFGGVHMGVHAEYTAAKACVSREEQDQFSVESQKKAAAAMDGGKFTAEIVAVEIPGTGGTRRSKRWPSSSPPSRRTGRSPRATLPD
jgi:acetyl-CoA C-acetyltransferase